MSDDTWPTSDVSDFDFDRSALESWQRFAGRLAEAISMMDAGATLSIGALGTGVDATGPYVRFTCHEGGRLVLEAHPEGPDAGVRLAEAGWTRGDGADAAFHREGTQDEPEPVAGAAADALREVFGVQHPALLAPDELADILTPTPSEGGVAVTPDEARPGATVGGDDHAALVAAVERELTVFLGHEPLRDDEGDLALRVGSTMVFVRPSPDATEVLVFASLVHDVEGRSRAMEVLSDLNTEARWVRFLLIRDRVYVCMSVMAAPLVPVHLQRALQTISLIGDSIDDALAEKLRGQTTFTE